MRAKASRLNSLATYSSIEIGVLLLALPIERGIGLFGSGSHKQTSIQALDDTLGMRHVRLLLRLLSGCLWVLMLGGTTFARTATGGPKMVEIGQSLPDIVMIGLNGPGRPISSFRGRLLIINVWASWCGPCKVEAASLERLAWSDAAKDYTIIGISTDDDKAAAQRWLNHSNATINHFIDSGLVLEKLLGASYIPLTVLIDSQGRVVAKFQGAREWDNQESINLIKQAYRPSKRISPKR